MKILLEVNSRKSDSPLPVHMHGKAYEDITPTTKCLSPVPTSVEALNNPSDSFLLRGKCLLQTPPLVQVHVHVFMLIRSCDYTCTTENGSNNCMYLHRIR